MGTRKYLGEFEQMVLLAILQRGRDANGYEVRQELEDVAERKVSKGAFYTTLDRLEDKGFLRWEARAATNGRGGDLPQRHFEVTPAGMEELRKSRQTLLKLWSGFESALGG